MKHRLMSFWKRDDGAVTVDWVVLTAAIVALGIAAGTAMTNSTTSLSESIWAYMDSMTDFE